jgi:hypothetical protein
MKEKSVVSIWIGTFDSEEKFIDFIREQYDEEGDLFPSAFMEAFGIDEIKPDFQEVLFLENISREDISQASYAESFIDKIEESVIHGNCIILLYDFCYTGKIQTSSGLNFIGVFEYSGT